MTTFGAYVRRLVRALSPTGTAQSGDSTAPYPPDFDETMIDLHRRVAPYTMTSPERLYALRRGVEHVVERGISGAIVECGVWRGGSMMAVAYTLQELDSLRDLYLFDTFEGMTPPTDTDRDIHGELASDRLAEEDRATGWGWAVSPRDEVEQNLRATGYDPDRIIYVEGRVEDTVPAHAPEDIALLRLDTDWYESTKHELEHLYPRLAPGGILIIDDYGHWSGAKRAVDEYLRDHDLPLFLHRIDYTGRIAVKPHTAPSSSP